MIRSAVRSPLLPVVLLAVVAGLDAIAESRRWRVLVAGMLDEPAHLATAVLVLIAVAGPRWLARHRGFTIAAGVASVAIDADHIPLYAGVPHIAVDGGRPFTHSLFTVAVLLLVALVVRRGRAVTVGLAVGVGLHLFRDLASGPGVSLFWPFYFPGLHVHYLVYLALLALAAIVGTGRMVTAGPWRRTADSTMAADVTTSTAIGAKNERGWSR